LIEARRLWSVRYADKKFLETVVNHNKPGTQLDLDYFLDEEPKDVHS
jgi:hypothetical protein